MMTKNAMLKLDDWPDDYEAQFWKQYPLRVAKKAAMKALAKVRKEGGVTFAAILLGVERYAAVVEGREPRFIKHPATWINAGCWDDEHPTPTPPKPSFFQQVYGGAGRRH